MHKVEIPEINFKKEFPENIGEMNSEQYLYFISQVVLLQQKIINITDFKTRILINLLEIKITAKYIAMTPEAKQNIDANIHVLSQLIDSFFKLETQETEEGSRQIKVLNLYSPKNFIPKIKHNNLKLYGPADALTDITFLEYIHAHEHAINYFNSNNIQDLDKLVAVLYRPEIYDYKTELLKPDFNGQRRIKYNSNTVNERAEFIATLPYHIKYAVLKFFTNSEEYFSTEELTIAGNRITLSGLFKKQKNELGDYSERFDDIGWLSILYAVAESGVFGNAEKTAEQNLYDILIYLYNNKKNIDDFKSKNKIK